jgi:GNAT superfamily N-acetyltransferase
VSRQTFRIRPCVEADATTLANLVRELAVYEQLESFVTSTAEDFRAALFGPQPLAEAILAEVEGTAVGYAFFFTAFSTFRGQPGIYLEDLFVRPEHRGRGIGKALMATVARRVVERGGGRLEWAVLDWNTPSIAFYEAAGASPVKGWTAYRIHNEPLARLAAQAP